MCLKEKTYMQIKFSEYRKHKYYFLYVLLFVVLHGYAKDKIDVVYIDSLSYEQYMQGQWEELIQTGRLAKKSKIDFMYLQQRLGYAHFVKKQYYKSMYHYEKARKYDKKDELTRLFQYYNAQYTGRLAYARQFVSKLSEESRDYLQVPKFKLIDAIDLEYSHKFPSLDAVHEASYTRIGLNSLIAYQFSLYQTFAYFNQRTDSTTTTQYEYFISAGWTPLSHTHLNVAYHYMGAKVSYEGDTYSYPGHVFYTKASYQINRFDLALSGAYYNSEWLDSKQIGLHAGLNFAGPNPISLNSSFYQVFEETTLYGRQNRNIFKQTAGIMLFDRFWTEAMVSIGNLNYFIDNNALYVYNSLDSTVFRTGASIFYYLNQPFTVFFNYTYDLKEVLSTNTLYNQHSITGGLIWQL